MVPEPGLRVEPGDCNGRLWSRCVRPRLRAPQDALQTAEENITFHWGLRRLIHARLLGLLFIIQNVANLLWGTQTKAYTFMAYPVSIFGALFAANRLVTLAFAVAFGIIFYLFLVRTRLGKAIRAAAQDPSTASLMGVNINQVLALCFGFGALMAGLGGLLVSMSYPMQTTMGLEYTIITIIVVAVGGMGSIPGSFIGGFLLGLIGSIVTKIEPGLSLAAYYLLFMLLLWIKPTGIMGK